MNIATKVTPNIIATKDVSLEDKYVSDNGTAFMTGIQALVRLPLAQTRRDAINGYHTAGFISGYRGSPIGNYDNFLWQVEGLLKSHNVVFQLWCKRRLGCYRNLGYTTSKSFRSRQI